MGTISTVTKYYVEYSFPGSFFSNYETKEMEHCSVLAEEKAPDGSYAFKFFTVEESEDGSLTGHRKPVGGIYYLSGARTYTLPELKASFPNEEILIGNMECNNWKKLVKTKLGNYQPFNKEDVIL